APFHADVLTIPVDEPRGMLRSWDVRADGRADAPSCTAILDRPYATADAFPAWFVNITGFAAPGDRPVARQIAMDVSGSLIVHEPGRFSMAIDRGTPVYGTIGAQTLVASSAETAAVDLQPGAHAVHLHAALLGNSWRFVPNWN